MLIHAWEYKAEHMGTNKTNCLGLQVPTLLSLLLSLAQWAWIAGCKSRLYVHDLKQVGVILHESGLIIHLKSPLALWRREIRSSFFSYPSLRVVIWPRSNIYSFVKFKLRANHIIARLYCLARVSRAITRNLLTVYALFNLLLKNL